MRGNGDDGHDGNTFPSGALVWPKVKKEPVSARRLILSIGLPHTHSVHPFQRLVLVGVQARMASVEFEQAKRLQDLLVQTPFRWVDRERFELPGGFVCESQMPLHSSVFGMSGERAEILGSARDGVLQTTFDRGQSRLVTE